MYRPIIGAEVLEVPAEVQAMFDWAMNKGIKWPKIVYPVRFPPGYIGAMATEDIYPGEAIVTAPNDSLLTSKVARNSDLKQIFEENPEIFGPKAHYSSDSVLSAFILSEKFKTDSEWAAFIGYQPKSPSNLQDWTREELQELQDPDLVFDTEKTLESQVELWEKWRAALAKYPDRFSAEMISLQQYTWAIRIIGTRTFGKFAPYTTFFPVGELLNHDNVQSYYIYLRPEEVADSSNRYAGRNDDIDHDGWIYEINATVELTNMSYTVLSLLLNDGIDESLNAELKKKAKELDDQAEVEEASRKTYKPQGIDLSESPEKEIRTMTGATEHYSKGSEVYMSYGRYSNRQLLAVYGFSLKVNHFNYAVLKTQVKSLVASEEASLKLSCEDFTAESFIKFKLKQKKLCLELIAALRKLWWNKNFGSQAFFEPSLLELEVAIFSHALKVLNDNLATYPTSYEEDLRLLESQLPLRKYFAVLYRSQVKEIVLNQICYVTSALNLLNKVAQGESVEVALQAEIEQSMCSESISQALSEYLSGLAQSSQHKN